MILGGQGSWGSGILIYQISIFTRHIKVSIYLCNSAHNSNYRKCVVLMCTLSYNCLKCLVNSWKNCSCNLKKLLRYKINLISWQFFSNCSSPLLFQTKKTCFVFIFHESWCNLVKWNLTNNFWMLTEIINRKAKENLRHKD